MLQLARMAFRRPAAWRSVGAQRAALRAKADEAGRGPPEAAGWYWTQHPMVRARINMLVSGRRDADAYGRLAEFLEERGHPRPLGRCISLGCGSGGLERDLARRGLVGEIDGYDLSAEAIAEARRLASEEGLGSIRYHVADLVDQDLPAGAFDAVFAHSSMHRVEALEGVFAAVRRALKPGGLFHLHEFVGPSRLQWADLQMRLINKFLDSLPERLLQTPAGRKPHERRPTTEEMMAIDPTEAVRSAEIKEVLAEHFDIVEERPFGGTLLHMGLAGIAQNFDVGNPEDVALLERFFDLEDQVITNGMLGSDFAVLTATLASGTPGRAAGRTAPAKPMLSGISPTRELRPPPGFDGAGMKLTVSKADTMLVGNDAHYLSVGRSALAAIERALGGAEPRNILDLPCGFGRVTRALRARFPHASITVSDLDRPGMDFSAREFDARPACSVRDFRELDLGETYDLIWVGSLMTHLPAAQTEQLLLALRRHLSPGGAALVTLHGPSIIPRLRKAGYGLRSDRARAVIEGYERTGFGYSDYESEEDQYGVSLTNESYGISLTDETWMRTTLERCALRLQDYEVRAWDDHHDVAVARG